jgi:hypothetical protein
MGNDFKVVRDSDIEKSIHELSAESTKLKAEIFKTIVMSKELDKQNIKRFESYINTFLKFWSDHSNELKSAIKNVKTDNCDEGIDTIEYSYIKDFIYGDYDYASILHFVDGMIKGVNDKTMKTPTDLDDFKNHTIDLAFNHLDPNVAGLLDSVLSEEIKSVKKKADPIDIKMFDTIRNYNDLFSFKDRPELYKSITKTLEYITTHNIAPAGYDHDNVRLFISLVNNIVEYIRYSLTVYAVRIFVISQYADPFINCNHPEDSKSITESADVSKSVSLSNISENPNGAICSVFHGTDENIIKDPKRDKEFIDKFDDFLILVGAESLFKDSRRGCYSFYIDADSKTSNKLYKELKDNILYDFFTTSAWIQHHRDKEMNLVELNETLKIFMYNKHQGIQGSVTPKNEFLNILQKIDYGSTVKDYQKFAYDVSTIAVDLSIKINQILNDKSWQLAEEMTGHNWKPGTRKSVAESIKFLNDLYDELMFAFVQKAGYIERRINELRSKEIKKVIDITSLNISGLKSDISSVDSMMLSVPNTTRSLTEQTEFYALPIIEAYEMHDEYLRSLPEFANDWYLKEIAEEQTSQGTAMKDKIVDVAGSTISGIINKIRSILQSLWQRIQYFWNSQSFVLAKKWVVENEETLRGLQFPADAKLEILPYKDEVSLPKGFSNIQKNLLNFNEKVLDTPDSLQKYLRSLYPNDQVAQWFANDPEGKVAAQKYMNLILFDEGSEQPKKPIVITGADITKKMDVWIKTIKESDSTKDGFKKINDDITNAIGSINSKIVNVSSQNKQAPDAASTDASQAAKANNEKDIKGNPAADKMALVSDASNRITTAITRLWSPLAPMIIRAMMNQYGYIKAAHALGQGTHQTHTPEGAGVQQKGQL